MKNILSNTLIVFLFSSQLAFSQINPAENQDISSLREDPDNPLVEIQTSMGSMILELFPEEAPETVANFIGLAQGEKSFEDPETGALVTRLFYDGLIFHRVIDGFMIQGGSPTGIGNGTPGYSFNDEINARSLGLDRMQAIDDEGIPHPFLRIASQTQFQAVILEPLFAEMNISSQEDLENNYAAIEQAINSLTVKDVYENQGYEYYLDIFNKYTTLNDLIDYIFNESGTAWNDVPELFDYFVRYIKKIPAEYGLSVYVYNTVTCSFVVCRRGCRVQGWGPRLSL